MGSTHRRGVAAACVLAIGEALHSEALVARGVRVPSRREKSGTCDLWAMHTPVEGQFAVRIGDAERDTCLEALGEHHAHGRLTADELERRQQAALTAVTEADVAALLSDLPATNRQVTSLRAPERASVVDNWLRGRTIAELAAVSCSLTAGGVLVADLTTDEHAFVVGFGATALGYVTHLLSSKWPSRRR